MSTPRGDLRHEFSLSASASHALNTCRRMYYWQTYGSWGGWIPAPLYGAGSKDRARLAYTLKRGTSVPALLGDAVHVASAAFLRELGTPTLFPRQIADLVRDAERRMDQVLADHLAERWRENPKKYPVLLPLFYGRGLDAVRADLDAAKAKLPRLLGALARSVHVQNLREGAELVGIEDAQKVTLEIDGEAVTVWVVPDLVYWPLAAVGLRTLVIVDWKTGRRRVSHGAQLDLYGLWAHQEHAPDLVITEAAYLSGGYSDQRTTEAGDGRGMITAAFRRARRLLRNGDIEANRPREITAFPKLEPTEKPCRWCDYRRLCDRG